MAWQDAEHPLGARRDDHLDALLGEHFALGGDDLDPKWHGVRIAER
jgi:hypothetical protein